MQPLVLQKIIQEVDTGMATEEPKFEDLAPEFLMEILVAGCHDLEFQSFWKKIDESLSHRSANFRGRLKHRLLRMVLRAVHEGLARGFEAGSSNIEEPQGMAESYRKYRRLQADWEERLKDISSLD